MSQSRSSGTAYSLGKVALLAGLSPETLAGIEKRCAWRTYRPGEPIIGRLDRSDDVFFVAAGEARASLYSVDGKAITFCDLGAGDVFGELAAIDGAARSASIEARSQCVVASMAASTFRNLLKSEPDVALALMRQMVSRIRSLTTRVYEFSTLAVANRIQAEILRLAELTHSEGGAARIDPAPTHADIASRTSTHREAVTRELRRLARIGLIERQGRALLVKNLGRLGTMVHEATGE
jgi:CRP-like cAMP-binding protein